MKTIIVVDDESSISKLIATFLKMKGYQTKEFSSGNQCIDYFQSGGTADLVLSDMKMADGDGLSILKYLNSVNNSTPFFFMTGFSDIGTSQMLEFGAKKVLSKPFKNSLLISEIEALFNEQSQNVA